VQQQFAQSPSNCRVRAQKSPARCPGAPPIKLEWVLIIRNGVYQISDLNLDGVSMAITQRSEFAVMIQRSGGSIAGLLMQMRQIVAQQGA